MSVSSPQGVSYGSASQVLTEYIQALNQTTAGTITLPARARIIDIVVKNNTANVITGGLKFGTTNGGTEVVLALAVGNAALTVPLASLILLRVFSLATSQVIYFDTVTSWNSAAVDITILFQRLP